MEELGAALVEEEIKRRKILPRSSFAKSIVTKVKDMDAEIKPTSSKRGRCYICPQRSSSTKYATNVKNLFVKLIVIQ